MINMCNVYNWVTRARMIARTSSENIVYITNTVYNVLSQCIQHTRSATTVNPLKKPQQFFSSGGGCGSLRFNGKTKDSRKRMEIT